MDQRRQIFAVRLRIDSKSQPMHIDALRSLENCIKTHKTHHPYGPNTRYLKAVPVFGRTCQGLPAALSGLRFAYRIMSFSSAIMGIARLPYRFNSAERNWLLLAQRYSHLKNWVPLDQYATGALPGRRDFHWWTTVDLSVGRAITNGHRVGKPNNWLDKYSIVLRLDLSRCTVMGAVPTVIDGFDSVVFGSVDYSSNPPMGLSIDLRNPDALTQGLPEFVIRDIPVSMLDCKPTLIDDSDRKLFDIDICDNRILDRLLGYYREVEESME